MMDLLGKKLAAAALMGAMILPAAGALAADNNGNPAVSVTADTLEYNGKTQVATATGNVVIVRDQATMTGNKAVYNLKTAEADMEGNVAVQQPNMQPLNNIEKNVVYSGSKQNVILTMIAGKVLYERGEFMIGDDPAQIYAEANRIIRGMK